MQRSGLKRAGRIAGCLVSTALAVSAAGCGNGDNGNTAPPGGGDAAPPAGGDLNLSKVANDPGITSPFDATPDPAGKNVYFTALGPKGPGVFKVSAQGGPIAEVFSGDPFVSPFSIAISNDGNTLFVADTGAETASGDAGTIFSLSIAGGSPTALGGTDGTVPRGIEVAGDQVYFTGIGADGNAGVFQTALSGGKPSTVASGGLLRDPSGVAIAKSGDVYVVDASSPTTHSARILKIALGAVSVYVDDIAVGYPAGIVFTLDESTLLVSALDANTGTDVVLHVDVASKKVDQLSKGIDTFVEAAGLHRAKGSDVFAWADSAANKTGTVYVLSK